MTRVARICFFLFSVIYSVLPRKCRDIATGDNSFLQNSFHFIIHQFTIDSAQSEILTTSQHAPHSTIHAERLTNAVTMVHLATAILDTIYFQKCVLLKWLHSRFQATVCQYKVKYISGSYQSISNTIIIKIYNIFNTHRIELNAKF